MNPPPASEDPGPLHLLQLPDQLRRLRPDVGADVLAIVDAEHAGWRQLHDRLVALIAALLDVAAADQGLQQVIDGVIAGATVELDELVSSRVDAREIAALLRAHGSTGSVRVDGDTTTFRHECGSGLRYWRDNPDVVTVEAGEVEGVPSGRPRYCARCIRSIDSHAGGRWTVQPPARPEELCVWQVRSSAGAGQQPG